MPEKKPLLSLTPRELAQLHPETVKHLVTLADRSEARQARYAHLGMVCGSCLFAFCVGVFVALIMRGHDVAAGVLLGTAVLGFLSQFLRARL